MTIQAIYENGVFKPVGPVEMPEGQAVEVRVLGLPTEPNRSSEGMDAIYDLLSKSYETGITNLAERHNELDP